MLIANLMEKLPADILTGYMHFSNIPESAWKNYFHQPLTVYTFNNLLYLIATDVRQVAVQKTEEGEMYDTLKKGKELIYELANIAELLGYKISEKELKLAQALLLGEVKVSAI